MIHCVWCSQVIDGKRTKFHSQKCSKYYYSLGWMFKKAPSNVLAAFVRKRKDVMEEIGREFVKHEAVV